MKTIHLIAGLAVAALGASAWAAPQAISATLRPNHIALGDAAVLTVSLRGQQADAVRIPSVNGLEIEPAGQSTSMQIINGAISASSSYQYNVVPRRTGDFTIPAITAGGATAQPIALRVDPTSGARSSQPGRAGAAPPLPAPGLSSDDNSGEAKDGAAFLRIEVPKKALYVGEAVPVKIQACFRAGTSASLDGLPMLGSDAFALAKLSDQPAQTEETIDGQPYSVLTWESTLSGVKAGDYPLNLDLPVVLRVRERGRRGGHNPFKDLFGEDSPFGSMLDDSFFDNFGGGVTEKPLTLHSGGKPMHIQSLPSTSRPTDFTGAVGDFSVSAATDGSAAASGDPLTLKIKITGHGNFDRVTTAGLARSAAWKTYKTSAKFEPSDSSGLSGTKVFEQAIIPAKAGQQDVPALSFSYFDPAKGQYVTTRTEPIALQVAEADPSRPAVAPAPAPERETSSASPVASATAAAPSLHDSPVASLRPLLLRPWFVILNALILAAPALVFLARWMRRRAAQDPKRVAREAAEGLMKASLAEMETAIESNNAPKFFEAARCAVSERLAEHWQLPASEINSRLLIQRLNGSGQDLRDFFRTADEAAYCGRRFAPAELRQWRETVQLQLQSIPAL